MCLDERNGGHDFLGLTAPELRHEAYCEAYAQREDELSQQFGFLAQPLLVVLEDLDVIIGKAQASEPQGGNCQEYGVDVVQTAEEQGSGQYGEYYDYASHCRGALLGHLALEAQVPDGLAYLFLLKPGYDLLARHQCHQQGCNAGHHRPEGDVIHKSSSRQVPAERFE